MRSKPSQGGGVGEWDRHLACLRISLPRSAERLLGSSIYPCRASSQRTVIAWTPFAAGLGNPSTNPIIQFQGSVTRHAPPVTPRNPSKSKSIQVNPSESNQIQVFLWGGGGPKLSTFIPPPLFAESTRDSQIESRRPPYPGIKVNQT